MTDDLTAQVAEIFLDLYDAWNNTTCEDGYPRTTYEEFVAPRIAACMRAVKESTRLNAWIPEDEAEPLIAAAGLAALRGET